MARKSLSGNITKPDAGNAAEVARKLATPAGQSGLVDGILGKSPHK
jgi:hypothetical protein